MIIIDDFDEGLNLAAFALTGFRHAASNLGGIAFDARDKGVGERMCFGTGI